MHFFLCQVRLYSFPKLPTTSFNCQCGYKRGKFETVGFLMFYTQSLLQPLLSGSPATISFLRKPPFTWVQNSSSQGCSWLQEQSFQMPLVQFPMFSHNLHCYRSVCLHHYHCFNFIQILSSLHHDSFYPSLSNLWKLEIHWSLYLPMMRPKILNL